MFHLLLAACLADDPGICAERLLPAADATSQEDCLRKGEPIARDWLVRHPGLRGGSARCVASEDLPALPVTEAADRVHVHLGALGQPSRQNQGRIANLSFVIGDSVAVIDAGGSRAEGEALYAAIRRITDKPVSHLILTHAHPDHILGAEVFAEAGATIIASANLPRAVTRRAPAWKIAVPGQIGPQAFLGTRIAPIDRPLDSPAEIALGRTRLTVTPQPSAHTDSDLLVHDAGSGTLFAGDLIFRDQTPTLEGSLGGWIGWLSAPPPEPAPSLIVPGHGPLATDWSEATTPGRHYLEALRDTTARATRSGLDLPRAIPAIVALLKPWSEGWTDFPATSARNAAAAYSEMVRN